MIKDSSPITENFDLWKKIIHWCPLMEKALGSTRVTLIKNRRIMEAIETTGSFILDLCDYSRLTISQMTKDLNGIQAFWENNLCVTECDGGYNQKGNLIIFFQAELFYGHHFLGKMKVIDLKPFTPDEMTSYLFSRFPLNNPFEKDAIHEIAALSRGIMRRFKNYINIALENSIEGLMITKQNIIEWIGLDQIVKDMELELMTIFPKGKEHRTITVKLLRYLREKGGSAYQTEIANEVFSGAKMKASRVLSKLESYTGYITRSRDKTGDYKVSLI
jgi:hypothetical protein